jgi:glycosyltransferase involved in cell wall biosynthesis
MTQWQHWVVAIYAWIVGVWVVRHIACTFIFRRLDRLTPSSPRYAASDPPKVTAIIPAKDEEAVLADCINSVCRQSYDNLAVLVVDDRSTDRTVAIARVFERQDPRVSVLSIDALEDGWTGKTHALHVATGRAESDWYWFVDADTRHHEDALSIMMEYARRSGAKLASLMPELRCETFWEKALQPLMGIVLMRSYPTSRVNNDKHPLAFANGQFLLVERDTYEAAGGHSAVRDRFVEDIYMSKRVKAMGIPIRVALGTEISSTRMYTSLPQIIRGWSRILYDGLGRKPWPIIWKGLDPLIFSQTGDIALVWALALFVLGKASPFAWWLLGLSLVHQVLKTAMLWRLYRLTSPKTAGYAAWYTVSGFVSDWIFIDALRSCLTGRVTWRGTSYGRPRARAATAREPEVASQGPC